MIIQKSIEYPLILFMSFFLPSTSSCSSCCYHDYNFPQGEGEWHACVDDHFNLMEYFLCSEHQGYLSHSDHLGVGCQRVAAQDKKQTEGRKQLYCVQETVFIGFPVPVVNNKENKCEEECCLTVYRIDDESRKDADHKGSIELKQNNGMK